MQKVLILCHIKHDVPINHIQNKTLTLSDHILGTWFMVNDTNMVSNTSDITTKPLIAFKISDKDVNIVSSNLLYLKHIIFIYLYTIITTQNLKLQNIFTKASFTFMSEKKTFIYTKNY